MITSSVTSMPFWPRIVSPTSSAARSTEDDAQGQDANNGQVDSSDSSDSSLLASGVPPVIGPGESASAGLESFRTAMLFFANIAKGISAGRASERRSAGGIGQSQSLLERFNEWIDKVASSSGEPSGLGNKDLSYAIGCDSLLTITPPFLSAGCNLQTDDGRDEFWKHLSDRFEIIQWYQDHVTARLQCTEQSSLRIECTADSESGLDTEGLDSDKAASMARLVASQIADGSSVLSAMVNNLDNRVAAALLNDRNF
jgi:hypothetical protein